MAKANSTRRKVGTSPSKTPRPLHVIQQAADAAMDLVRQAHIELNHHPESVKAREPDERQNRLYRLREAAAKSAPELPDVENLLIDCMGAQETVANVRSVLAFLERSELTDAGTSKDAENGRWHIHKWLVHTLEHADSQMEREKAIDRAVIAALNGGK